MPDSSSRAIRGLLLFSLLVLGISFGIQKIRTFDYWWHLRTGELILETGEVPKYDVFTYTVEGSRYIDIHWLHQVALYGLYRLAGHDGVVVGKAVLVCGLLAILGTIGWRRERAAITVFALAWMLAVAGDRLMPRPELPSFLFLAGVLALLERHERTPEDQTDRAVWWIVAIQLVWANVHGLFALGLAVVGMYLAAEVGRPLLSPGKSLRPGHVARLAGVLLAGALVSLLNPNFVDGAIYPIQQLGMIGPPEDRGMFGSLIAELIPPLGPQGGMTPLALAMVGGLGLAAFVAMVLNWRQLPAAHPLLWVSFGYLALGARRNLALFAIVVAPILVQNLNEFLDRRRPAPRLWNGIGLATSALALALAFTVSTGRYYERTGSTRDPGLGVLEFFYPMGAIEWVAQNKPPGPIAHHMADGGYLLWRLYPEYRSMTDGRLEVFGAETFAKLSVNSGPRLRQLDEQYRFGSVLVHYSLINSEGLLRWLYFNYNWRLVYVDSVAALFVRVPESGELPWPELDLDDPDLFGPLPDGPGTADQRERMARTNFFTSLRRYEQALALWEETIELYPDMGQGPIIHAKLLAGTGKTAAAEAIFRRLLEEKPEDSKLLAQLGDLRLEGGDPSAAKEFYDRAVAIDPRFAYALVRRAGLAEAEGDTEYAIGLYARVLALTNPFEPLAITASGRLTALGGAQLLGEAPGNRPTE